MEKMTKRNFYEAIANFANEGHMAFTDAEGTVHVITNEVLAEFAEKEIDALDKKAEKAKERAAKRRAEGDDLTEALKAILTDEYQITSELMAQVEMDDVSPNKIQARMKKLIEMDIAEKAAVNIPATETTKATHKVGYRIKQ
jgi:predicted transcriptional regulator